MRCLSVVGDCSSCVMNSRAQDEKHILAPSIRYVEDEPPEWSDLDYKIPVHDNQTKILHAHTLS